MLASRDFWEERHRASIGASWEGRHSDFAEEVAARTPRRGRLLDLGCGRGFDSCYFADLGFSVTAVDIAQAAFDLFGQVSTGPPPTLVRRSIEELPYPFESGHFDFIYARLSLHYFSAKITRKALREIHRLLARDGTFAMMVNSVNDPEFKQGRKLEADFFELGPGSRKRFLSRASLHDLTKDLFIPYVLEYSGLNGRDDTNSFVRLIASRR